MPTKGSKKRFCPKGHNTFITGRDKSGSCELCKQDYVQRHRIEQRNYRLVNIEKTAEYSANYYKRNKKQILLLQKEYKNKKRKDVNFKLIANLRNRLSSVFRKNLKFGSAVKDLGCSTEFLKAYIEFKFQSGMSWNNYGISGWHIDHIIPLSKFDLTDREQFLQAVHYTNLQPLWAKDNIRKSNKLIKDVNHGY